MGEKDLYKLLERSIQAQETSNSALSSLGKAVESLDKNTCNLNDNFVLHSVEQTEITKELKLVKEHLLVWIKWLVTIIIGVLGMAAGIKQITNLL